MRIIDEKLMFVSVKKFPASCAHNRNHLPSFFTLFATEFEGAYCAAYGTFVQIFSDSMLGGEAFCFQYLENTLSRDVKLFAYL
jgi:hypothetical protein